MTTITIDYYSDILCVWAYVAQIRMQELQQEFGEQVTIRPVFFPVFGSVEKKLQQHWGSRGGQAAYATHVQGVVSGFGHVALHADTWSKTLPASSLPAHLYLHAAWCLEQHGHAASGTRDRFAHALREAFFARGEDISCASTLGQLSEQQALSMALMQQCMDNGKAFASLADDMKQAVDQGVKSSPTMIFNEDRQRLSGNVGYRIIQANIRELLQSPNKQHSWC